MSYIIVAIFVKTKLFVNKGGSKRVYLQIAKNVKENGRSRQKLLCTLGRLKNLQKGGINNLICGPAKLSEKFQIIEINKDPFAEWGKEYAVPLLFRKLFTSLGLEDILQAYLAPRNHSFRVKEAVFAVVLNSILCPSSKLRVYEWLGLFTFAVYHSYSFLTHRAKGQTLAFEIVD